MKFKTLVTVTSILLSSCSAPAPEHEASSSSLNFYTQSGSNRVASEWEPASGVMIGWPLSIPHKLVIEFARDTQLYVLVPDRAAQNDAITWFGRWGMDSQKIKFIEVPQGVDAWWIRDWGPSAVYTSQGESLLGDGHYIYSTPVSKNACDDSLSFLYMTDDHQIIKTEIDDNATVALAKGLNAKVLDLPFINTGGNVLTDGLGSAFSTCILTNENRFHGIEDSVFFRLNRELLGFERYHIISNFERAGIQHIDCYMKLLDEERILVAEPPRDHYLHAAYQTIIDNELSKLKTPYGRPYTILRLKTNRYNDEQLAAYTNAIILNKTIYVPLFNIPDDEMALNRWREVMPGYSVKGFTFDFKDEPAVSKEMRDHYTTGYGWADGDALHCRARAVWDPEMIFMNAKRIDSVYTSAAARVYVTVIDYSKKGLVNGDPQLFWKSNEDKQWRSLPLIQMENEDHYYVDIPEQNSGNRIEYYITAASHSGRKETWPRTAPVGVFSYLVE